MEGVAGRLFREFSVTLAFAIAVSTFVSLTVTPMVCAYFVRQPPSKTATWLDRVIEGALSRMILFYDRTLAVVIERRGLTLIVFFATIALTVGLYIKVPKGYFPQDDTGLIFGGTQAHTDISYEAMLKLQQQAMEVVLSDPAVAALGASVGSGGGPGGALVNRGRLFVSLKPLAERGNLTTQQVINRMRPKLASIPGLRVFMFPAQDVRAGGRQSDSQYQFTLWSADIDQLQAWVPKVVERVKQIPGLVDFNTDREQGGLQADISIDRVAAARLGVRIQDISSALSDSFAQRQVATIYGNRNQYRVILEVDRPFSRDPNDLSQVYVPGNGGEQIPLSAVTRVTRGTAPLSVNHQGLFPSTTITYNVAPEMTLEEATQAISQAVAEMHLPDVIRTDFAGDIKQFKQAANAQTLLLLAALVAVYIVLGILYESLAHPLTIVSTLPSAGLGALLALQLSGTDLSIIAFIGIILLVGIVKKNGIMMVDFALEAERRRGLSPERAIHEACLERFRPILMTTMAAFLGAIPLVVAVGPSSELRRPLGITIMGGLLVSQILTLYTTPVIYLMLDKLHRRLGGGLPSFVRRRQPPSIQPAE
jgi:multidrug efflux pump